MVDLWPRRGLVATFLHLVWPGPEATPEGGRSDGPTPQTSRVPHHPEASLSPAWPRAQSVSLGEMSTCLGLEPQK